jgi:hypothetical protein
VRPGRTDAQRFLRSHATPLPHIVSLEIVMLYLMIVGYRRFDNFNCVLHTPTLSFHCTLPHRLLIYTIVSYLLQITNHLFSTLFHTQYSLHYVQYTIIDNISMIQDQDSHHAIRFITLSTPIMCCTRQC